MSTRPDKKLSRNSRKRLTPFLDCTACLLAKRWLQDQRQEAARPPRGRRKRPEHRDEPSAS